MKGARRLTTNGKSDAFARAAREFCVWREGSAVDWDCSLIELSQAVGMERGSVSNILKRKGWSCKTKGKNPFGYAMPVDSLISGNRSIQYEARL